MAITNTNDFSITLIITKTLEEYIRLYTLAKQMGDSITQFPE